MSGGLNGTMKQLKTSYSETIDAVINEGTNEYYASLSGVNCVSESQPLSQKNSIKCDHSYINHQDISLSLTCETDDSLPSIPEVSAEDVYVEEVVHTENARYSESSAAKIKNDKFLMMPANSFMMSNSKINNSALKGSRKSVRSKKLPIKYCDSDYNSDKENDDDDLRAALDEDDDDDDYKTTRESKLLPLSDKKPSLMEILSQSQKRAIANGVKGLPNKRKKTTLLSEQDGLDQLNLMEWKRPIVNKPAPKIVEVIIGNSPMNMVTFADSDIFQLQNKCSINSPDYAWQEINAVLQVDLAGLEYKLQNRMLTEDDVDKLFQLIKRENNLSRNMKQFEPQCLPKSTFAPCRMPSGFQVQLKYYQQITVSWMKELEEKVEEGWRISRLINWKASGSNMLFDTKRKQVYFPPVTNTRSNSLSLKTKGGILADEMGLGKTVTLLGLLLSHKKQGPRIPRPDDVEWHDDLLPTGATLLIAPSHLTSQWKDEAEKCISGLKVIIITTKPQFDRTTYADVLRADLVVVSVQFLITNKCYTDLPHGDDAVAGFRLLVKKPGINPLLQTNPNFSHFYWWRLVCDEAHELMTYEDSKKRSSPESTISKGLSAVDQIRSKYRWYMTGTPFPNGEKSLRAALKFLHATTDDSSIVHPDGSLKVDSYGDGEFTSSIQLLFNIVLNHFYVRNTKQSIGLEYDVPEYVEELMLLKMSDVERGIYERSQNEKEKRQLCCHLQIAERMQYIAGSQQKTLEEVKLAMIEHTKKEITSCLNNVKTTENNMKHTREQLALETTPSMRKLLEIRIKSNSDSIVEYQKQVIAHKATIQYFESLIPRIEQHAEEPCVICLDTIKTLTVTPCGHLFCNNCISQHVQQQNTCPTCRKTIAPSQLFEVKDAKSKAEMQKMSELHRLTEQYGTKMAYLIFYLRYLFSEHPQSRVIVFSQWENLLTKIGETLDTNGLRNVFVKGNVHVRNKAINSFKKQEKVRVIMLSLEHAASGTNLIEASHIVLIDPVAGTKEKSVAIENQAIGRAHRMGQDKRIKVIRLIMRDTLEHELYSRNYTNENIKQLEMNFDAVDNYGVQVISTVKKVPLPTGVAKSDVVSMNAGTSSSSANSVDNYVDEEDHCDFDIENLDDLAWGHQCYCRKCQGRRQAKKKTRKRGGGGGGWGRRRWNRFYRRDDCSVM